MNTYIRYSILSFFVIFCGCSINGEPRPRLGSYATNTIGTNFIDDKILGNHSFSNAWGENNGIVYTCRGGHIDIAHVRIAADYTRYLSQKVKCTIDCKNTNLSFRLNVEPSTYFVTLTYPENWDTLTAQQKEEISREVSLELGAYFTYIMTTWHEVLTWFGYKCMMVVPENPSAFSWEDIYSNLMGIRLSTKVMSENMPDYDKALTNMLLYELQNLGIQSRETAREASEEMRNKWYTGITLVDMKFRNIDIGLDDGFVTPAVVEGICPNVTVKSYPIPTIEKFKGYGFELDLEIEPKEFEKDKILDIIYLNKDNCRIIPVKHLPLLVDFIKEQEIGKGNTVSPQNPVITAGHSYQLQSQSKGSVKN
ncbi:MAG: DUF4056 domain-containing protein [Sedimentisphaeraceae bacterium JB056]